MNYTVGQQILGGKAVIVTVNPTATTIVVEFTLLDNGFGEHPTISYDASMSLAQLEAAAQAVLTPFGL